MPSKTFTVRIPQGALEVTSEQVAGWLETCSPAELVPDPGAGERSLRLSLDADKVKAGAQAAGEPEAVFVRRLIASHVPIPEETGKAEAEPKPKAPVLKGALKLRQEQIRPLVSLVDAAQSFRLRRVFRLPPEPDVLQAAAYTEAEKDQLAAASVEVVNRRAPKWLVENADVLSFLSTFGSIELQKIERLRALAERYHKKTSRGTTVEPTAATQAAPAAQPVAAAQPSEDAVFGIPGGEQ
jgi:hypothetical protein